MPRALERYVELLHAELGAPTIIEHVLPGHSRAARRARGARRRRCSACSPATSARRGREADGGRHRRRSRFKVGAFGSDHANRPELPAIARARAEALLGRQIAGGDVVVIGDTPADIACGRGIGARAIGVATGRYSARDLLDCGAAAVFADLSDTEAVVRAIMGA